MCQNLLEEPEVLIFNSTLSEAIFTTGFNERWEELDRIIAEEAIIFGPLEKEKIGNN